ncbi:carboxymuconolactone decarboxylase family protein [Colwelliaceae bacterium BS250]
MSIYKCHTAITAPQPSVQIMRTLETNLGFIPNVFAIIAESPSALKGLVDLHTCFTDSTFTAQEQQIILLATSTENECVYCVAGHTAFAKSIGMDDGIVQAMRNKQVVPHHRFNALSNTVRALIQCRGQISAEQLNNFFAVGYTKAQLLELVMGICVKTFTNYISNALTIPLDQAFAEYAWQRPNDRAREEARAKAEHAA